MSAQTSVELRSSKGKPASLKTVDAGLSISSAGSSHTIPYYNILWAEFEKEVLTISYTSDLTKSGAKLEKQSWTAVNVEHELSYKEFADNLTERSYGRAKPKKRVYVLINPHSGPGGGLKKWQNHAKPLFKAAKMEITEVTLSKGGEATDLVEKMDINAFDAVVACSGDGTAYEVFNGLAKRPDASTALKTIAVGHLPCGSGNAMSLNLYGSNKMTAAAVGVIKGIVMPMDLVSITQGSTRTVSFLSQSLGIIAESDLATEHLRWMGSKRFEVGIITRVYQKRCYPCDIWAKVEIPDKEGVKQHYANHSTQQEGTHAETSTNGLTSPEPTGSEGLPALKYGTIQDDVENLEGWEKIDGDRVGNFYCGNMAWMSPDANFFPGSLPSDGLMDLVVMNGDHTLLKSIKAFLSVETGKFFDTPEVSYRKISAYRIRPRNQKDGFISIDGERVPFEPFQAEVHQGLGRVLSKNGRLYEAEGPLGWGKTTTATTTVAANNQETQEANGHTNNEADQPAITRPPQAHLT